MKERGTTGAVRLQITKVPRVRRHLGRVLMDVALGTSFPLVKISGVRPLTLRVVIHGLGNA